jgi:hypothetical protein
MFEIVQNLPSDVDVYLVSGTIRNALIRKYHGEVWPQRDYDQIVTNGSDDYFSYLYERGFRISNLDRPTQRVVAKPIVKDAKTISYEDNLVFDVHMVDGTTVEDNLRNNVGLLINGFALSLRDAFDPNWESKVLALPGALDCIKSKQIRINLHGYTSDANYFFACMRFIGSGLAAPPREEIIKLLMKLPGLEHERYQRNLIKLSSYVGGEAEARRIVKQTMGDEFDIFDEDGTKAFIAAQNIS